MSATIPHLSSRPLKRQMGPNQSIVWGLPLPLDDAPVASCVYSYTCEFCFLLWKFEHSSIQAKKNSHLKARDYENSVEQYEEAKSGKKKAISDKELSKVGFIGQNMFTVCFNFLSTLMFPATCEFPVWYHVINNTYQCHVFKLRPSLYVAIWSRRMQFKQ